MIGLGEKPGLTGPVSRQFLSLEEELQNIPQMTQISSEHERMEGIRRSEQHSAAMDTRILNWPHQNTLPCSDTLAWTHRGTSEERSGGQEEPARPWESSGFLWNFGGNGPNVCC